MALVQYQQITGDGRGKAPRPPLRLGIFWEAGFSGFRGRIFASCVKDGQPAVIELIICKVLKILEGGSGINFVVNRPSAMFFIVSNPAIPATRVHPLSHINHSAPREGYFLQTLRRFCWQFSAGVTPSTPRPWAALSNDQMERARTVDDCIGHQMAIEGRQLPSMGACEG